MSDILELIDNAIAGTTGSDAMRWTPEKPTERQVVDPEQLRAAFAAVGAQFAAALESIKPAMEAWARQITAAFKQIAKFMPVIEQIQAERRLRVSRMHAAYRRRRR